MYNTIESYADSTDDDDEEKGLCFEDWNKRIRPEYCSSPPTGILCELLGIMYELA